jgi:hypothetical protein
MTTISQELNQLERAINQSLTNHREQLSRQQAQITSLTQLLNSRHNDSLDLHCLSAMNRLIELLEAETQSTDRVYTVLNSLTQAKDAQHLTIDSEGQVAATLQLELAELAQRLKIDSPTKLSAAANSESAWLKLMTAHPDPDGYQWQRPVMPRFKLAFHHKTHRQFTGTKPVKLTSGSALN